MKITENIKTVYSGSGLKYPVHIGASCALWDLGKRIVETCGTSGGAIIAAALGCGIKPYEMADMAKRINPAKMLDVNWMPLGVKGIVAGNLFLRQLRIEFEETFEEAFKKSGVHCHVVTFNLTRGSHVVWSSRWTPKADLPLCVRGSLSLPFIFDPVTIKSPTKLAEPELHGDGGMGANFPLDIFGIGDDVVGLRFRPTTGARKITNKLEWASACVDGLIESTTREHVDDAIHARQVYLDSNGGGLDFNLTPSKVDSLMHEGYQSVMKAMKA